jgi:uncharacterized protein (TIRG00374 family)
VDARGKWKLFMGAALVVLLAIFIVIFAVEGRSVFETMRGLDPLYIMLALSAYAGVQLAWGLKWFLHVRKVAPKAGFLYVLIANMAGNFVSITTPSGRMAGEPVRAGAVARRYNAKFSDMFASTVVDKLGLTVGMISVFVPLVIYLYAKYDLPDILNYLIFLFFIFWIAVGLATFTIIKSMKWWKADRVVDLAYVITKFFKGASPFDRQALIHKISEGLKSFRETIKEQLKDPISMSLDLVLAVTIYLLRIVAAFMFFQAIGYEVSFVLVAITVHLGFIISLVVPVALPELSMATIYSVLGLNQTPAGIVAVLTQTNFYVFELGLGYVATWLINLLGVSKKVKTPS